METQVTFPCNEYGYYDKNGTATATGTVTKIFSETCWAKVNSKTIKGIPLSFLPPAPTPTPAPAPTPEEPEQEQEPEQPETTTTEAAPPLAAWLLAQKSGNLPYLTGDKIPAFTLEELREAESYFVGREEGNRGRISWLADKRHALEAAEREALTLQREIPTWLERRELPRDFSWEVLGLPPLAQARSVSEVLDYRRRIEGFRRSYLEDEADRCRELLRSNPKWAYQQYGLKHLGATKWCLSEWNLKELREAIDHFQIQDSGLVPGQRVVTPLGAGELKVLTPSFLQKSCFVLLDRDKDGGFREIFRLDEVVPEVAVEPESEPEPEPEPLESLEPEPLQRQLLNRALAVRNDQTPEWRAQWQIDSFGFQWRQHFDSRGWRIDVLPPCPMNDSGLAELLGITEDELSRVRDLFCGTRVREGRKSSGGLSARDVGTISWIQGMPHLLEGNILWISSLPYTESDWLNRCNNRMWMFDYQTANWAAPDYRRFEEDAAILPIHELAEKYDLAPAKAEALADAMGIDVGLLPSPPPLSSQEDLPADPLQPETPPTPPDELNPESEIVALSISQPWAWAIAAGFKDIENRGWPTRRRGRFLIHASKKIDPKGVEFLGKMGISPPDDLPLEALIGTVTLTDCSTNSQSPWAISGQYHFELKDPILWDDPLPQKGKLGFFSIHDSPPAASPPAPAEELPEFLRPPKPKTSPPADFTQLSLFSPLDQPPSTGGQEPLYQKSPPCTSSPCHSPPPTPSQPSSCGCGSVVTTPEGEDESNSASPPPLGSCNAEPLQSGGGSPRPEPAASSGGFPPGVIAALATMRGSQGRSPPLAPMG